MGEIRGAMTEDPGNWIDRAIGPSLDDARTRFVFPSQPVADSWALRCLRRGGRGAVDADRFLSWDRFRDEAFEVAADREAAGPVARNLWAAGVVARQRREPVLGALLGSVAPSHRFIPSIASLAQSLGGAPGGGKTRGEAQAPAAREYAQLERDLAMLARDYRDFLDGTGLHEAAWAGGRARATGFRYLLVEPGLVEGYGAWRASIEERSDVAVVSRGDSSPPYAVGSFPNAREEIRWVFLRLGELIDAGVHPEDLAVTSTALDRSLPLVLRTARETGVPCSVRSGRPLSRSPFGRFLSLAARCSARGVDFESVRDLLLDGALPWKNRRAARNAVRFGTERHVHRSFPDSGRRVDIWEETLRLCPVDPETAAFLRSLLGDLAILGRARDFAGLRESVMAFRSRHFDEDGACDACPEAWLGAERATERTMVELGLHVDIESRAGGRLRLEPGEPLELLVAHLDRTSYLPRQDGAGVPVYPYRVSALLACGHHFVIGCSQEAMRVRYRAGGALPEPFAASIGLGEEDLTSRYARAYSGLGNAELCWAAEDFEGWCMPESGAAPAVEPPGFDAIRANDPVLAENRAWRTGEGLPAVLCRWQVEAAGVSGSPPPLRHRPGADFTVDAASPETTALVLGSVTDGEGSLRLSATYLADYRTCPFSWLLARAAKIEEEPAGMEFFDARLAGELAHEVVRELYSRIRDDGGRASGGPGDRLRHVPDAIRAALARFERKHGPFVVPMAAAYLPRLRHALPALLAEDPVPAGWDPGAFEVPGSRRYPADHVILEGRADRIARSGDALVIVDYKKRALPGKAQLSLAGEDRSGGGAGGAARYQMAAYVRLFEEALPSGPETRVWKAGFYSIEEATWLPVIGDGGIAARDGYEPELAAFDGALAAVARDMRAGRFPIAPPGEEVCTGCAWRAVCRARFAAE